MNYTPDFTFSGNNNSESRDADNQLSGNQSFPQTTTLWRILEGSNVTFSTSGDVITINSSGGGTPLGVEVTNFLSKSTSGDVITINGDQIGTKADNFGLIAGDNISIGSSGRDFTVNYTGPTSAGGGGGSLNLLSTYTASTSSEITITDFDGSYDTYQIELINLVPEDDGKILQWRGSIDGGSTEISSSNYAHTTLTYTGAYLPLAQNSQPQGSLTLADGNTKVSNVAVEGGLSGTLKVVNPESDTWTNVNGQTYYFAHNRTLPVEVNIASTLSIGTGINAMTLFFDTNTIISGKVKVYGIS